MCLQSNIGKRLWNHKAKLASYKPHVWFDQKYITNLISLKNSIKQYHVTHNSSDEMFIFTEKNTERTICISDFMGAIYINRTQKMKTFFPNTVTGNKESYSKRQIKAAKQAKELYGSLCYPSFK